MDELKEYLVGVTYNIRVFAENEKNASEQALSILLDHMFPPDTIGTVSSTLEIRERVKNIDKNKKSNNI